MNLKTGYFISGIITGSIFLFSFLVSLPDGKLHIIACDVGQGDAIYIVFPDGRDMLIDGGPNNSVLKCLGDHQPFWDRHIDMVFLTHPQKDHMGGLVEILHRYTVSYFVRADTANVSKDFEDLMALVSEKKVVQKLVTAGEQVRVGDVSLMVIWPTHDQIESMKRGGDIDLNDGSVVFWIRYGRFDGLFTGDADIRVEHHYLHSILADNEVELLKVPHHGSKTGMSPAFLNWLTPDISVLSVGKNNYGHPTHETLSQLANINTQLLRTDQLGDIEIVTDGTNWVVK